MDYQQLCEEVSILARHVGVWLCSERQRLTAVKMEAKGIHDYVTQFDKRSEEILVARLRELVPDAGFITEEQTATGLAERFNWIIDPLDGTPTSSTECRPLLSASPSRNTMKSLSVWCMKYGVTNASTLSREERVI